MTAVISHVEWLSPSHGIFYFIGLNKKKIRSCLVGHLKYIFLVFKQYYMYFYILFHSHIFQKNINNITQIPLPNGSLVSQKKYIIFYKKKIIFYTKIIQSRANS